MRRIASLLFLLVLGVPAFAGTSAVTATITDSDSQTWNAGTFQVTFVPQAGTPASAYNVNGASFTQSFNGTMNGSGVLTVTLTDLSTISPTGGQWRFNLCPNASSACTGVVTNAVVGATPNLSTQLSTGLAGPRFPAGPTAFGYSDTEVSPTPPPGGTYFNVTSQTQRIWNGTAWGAAGGGSGGSISNPAAPIMAFYFTNACPTSNTGQCYFTSANTQIANDCNWASTGTTVTCNTSHFAATDVGKRVAGYLLTGSPTGITGCVAGRSSFSALTTTTAVTISTFTSGTQISLSSNPANTAGSNQGCFIWGTPDDSNASTFETTYAAISSFCPKVMLAAAGYWFSSPHFFSQPTGCAALPSLTGLPTYGNQVYSAGFELEGRGTGNTVIYLGPDFPGGDSCARTIGNVTNACFVVPVEGKWSDFQISGGGQSTCQVTNGRTLIAAAVGTLNDINVTSLCFASPTNIVGLGVDQLTQLYQVNNSGFGTICLQTANNAALVQAFKLGCENSIGVSGSLGQQGGASLDILNNSQFTCWGCLLVGGIVVGNNRVVEVGSGATLRLNGGVVQNCEAGSGCTTSSTYLVSNNGTVYMTDVVEGVNNVSTSPVVGYGCAASGGTLYLERSTLTNNNNATYSDVAGCKTYDLGGNAPIFNASSSANGTFYADGRSSMFSCTGTANASATNSLYGTGPNVTATTCSGQTSTLGAGIPFQQARTITGMICTSSATTVSVACTVMVNGSATSTTCTMTASTKCANVTATAVNPGDLLSARIVTGAAETGANIKMQVLWQ